MHTTFLCLDAKDMNEAFTIGIVITIDRTQSPGKVKVRIGDAEPGTGEIDEKFLLTHTGSVTFSDESNKKYNFWYYPAEGKIYWVADKGKSNDIWNGKTDPNGKCRNSFLRLHDLFYYSILGKGQNRTGKQTPFLF